jgi:hypothetical protein
MDGDLSHDPAALPDLLGAIEHGADLPVGSRDVAGGSVWFSARSAPAATASRSRRLTGQAKSSAVSSIGLPWGVQSAARSQASR